MRKPHQQALSTAIAQTKHPSQITARKTNRAGEEERAHHVNLVILNFVHIV